MAGTEEMWGNLPAGLLSIACSACFPIPPRVYCPGVAQWAQSFNVNHYQENILYRLAFRQFDGGIFTNDLSPFPRKFLSCHVDKNSNPAKCFQRRKNQNFKSFRVHCECLRLETSYFYLVYQEKNLVQSIGKQAC